MRFDAAATLNVAVALAAVALTAALLLIALAAAGFPPWEIITTWMHGAAGNAVRCALSLQEAGPLLLTGLAAAIAFRCGVLNIGAEGQYLVGAVTLVALTTRWTPPGPAWLVLIGACSAAVAAGATWALIATALERWRGVPVVLSTILLNFIAVYLVSLLVEGPLHDPTTNAPQTALMADELHLPVLIAGSKLHLGVVVAFALAVALWLAQGWTVLGFETLATGLNPEAARMAGIPVASRQALVMATSGGLAALGGALQVAGVTYFMSGASVSYGYAGIAVALLGRLHPLGVALAAVFFGMLDTGARNLEKHLHIPHDLGDVMKGLIVLAVLVGAALAMRRLAAPARAEAGGDDAGQ